jgi:hypothetical protein
MEMQRKKKAIGFGVALLATIGLALPTTASAATRSYAPVIGVQNTSMIVVVDVSPVASATGTVSWGDVSWGDASLVG